MRDTNTPSARITVPATVPVAIKVAATRSGAINTQAAVTRDDALRVQVQGADRLQDSLVKDQRSSSPTPTQADHQPWSPAPVLASARSTTDHSSAATRPTFKAQADSVNLHTADGRTMPASAQPEPEPRRENSQSGRVSMDAGRAVESRTSVAAAAIHLAPAPPIAAPGAKVDGTAPRAEARNSSDRVPLKSSESTKRVTSKSGESSAHISSKPNEPATRMTFNSNEASARVFSQSTPTSTHANSTPPQRRPTQARPPFNSVATVHDELPLPHLGAAPHQAQPFAQPSSAHATKMADPQSHDGHTPPAQAPHDHAANFTPAPPAPPAQANARSASAPAERPTHTEEPSTSSQIHRRSTFPQAQTFRTRARTSRKANPLLLARFRPSRSLRLQFRSPVRPPSPRKQPSCRRRLIRGPRLRPKYRSRPRPKTPCRPSYRVRP